jgi:hypothetical protein
VDFANVHGKHLYVVNAQAANNVVVAPFHSSTPFLLRATWYAADGSIVPTSDSALLHAIAARQNIKRKRIIRQDAHIQAQSRWLPKSVASFCSGCTERQSGRPITLAAALPLTRL